LRRSSGPYRSSGGAAVPQTFERSHPSLTSGGDSQSSGSQPPRFSRRFEPTVAEPQRVTVAAAPTLAQQPIAVVPAAVIPTPPSAATPVALAEQTNPPPARYMM